MEFFDVFLFFKYEFEYFVVLDYLFCDFECFICIWYVEFSFVYDFYGIGLLSVVFGGEFFGEFFDLVLFIFW